MLNRSFSVATCRTQLLQSDVALNLYDFVVQRPRANPVKFGLRAYDEVIIAPMVRHAVKQYVFGTHVHWNRSYSTHVS